EISSLVSRFDPVAIEVAAGFEVAFSFEFALAFAASVAQSIGRCRSFSKPPLGLFARPAKANNLAHPAPHEPLRGWPSPVASRANAPIAWRRESAVSSRPTGPCSKILRHARFGGSFQRKHRTS